MSVPGFPTGAGFCRALKLSPPQQVAVGLGLSRSSNPGVAKEGVKFLVARVPGLTGGGGGQLSLEALHSLLELVKSSEDIAGQVRICQLSLRLIHAAANYGGNLIRTGRGGRGWLFLMVQKF